MSNPFDSITGQKVKKEESYEEWGGAFSCQTNGCWNVEGVAKFYPSDSTLSWVCQDGHVSVIVYE
jgi:hypothetical protein